MKQIDIEQVKQLGSTLQTLNSAIDANDNSIIELNTAIETNSNSIVELNSILGGKQDTLIAGEGITIENNVIGLDGGNIKSALQVTCSYNDDVLKGVAVVVDETTITTKSNGLATFTGLDSGTKSIVASKDGYATNTSSKAVENPFETADVEMNPITLTFTVTDVEDNAIEGAVITLGDYTTTTNINGQVIISGILDGVYNYIITKATFTNATGIISINRQNLNEPVVMVSALIVGKASGSFSVGDTVKLNAGMGENNYDFTAYHSDTTQTNDLTVDGEVAEVKTDSIVLTEEPQIENAEITIEVEQDNADIQFNNSNDICTVNIVANAIDVNNYLAFKKTDNSIIYFKDNTLPFVPSENTYPSISFTYYTYEDNVMTSHTGTTQSAVSGDTTYDGTTLVIHSDILLLDGTWTRDISDDINNVETEYNDATITTSSYLTTPEAVIPRQNYWRFAMEKLNPQQWKIMTVLGGSFITLANLQEIVVPNNTQVDMYLTKADEENPKMFVNTYKRTFTITNDKIFKKVKFYISTNVNANITLKVNLCEFNYNNTKLAELDVYEGDTVSWTVSAEGYTTQTGSFAVPSYPLIKEKIQEVTLS
jgi:hypothetical protein